MPDVAAEKFVVIPGIGRSGDLMLYAFIREEDGLEWVEWAIVAAFITGAAVVALGQIGGELANRFGNLLSAVSI